MATTSDSAWAPHYAALGSSKSAAKDRKCSEQISAEVAAQFDEASVKRQDSRESDAVIGVMLNLTKNIVGAGILCLPFALQEGGAGLGVLSLAVTGAFSLSGFLAIGKVCDATGARSYREAWQNTVGTSPLIVDVAILFECVITCIGYVILILDYLGTGLQGLAGLQATEGVRMRIAVVVSVTCLMPLCLRPNMDSLKFSSLIGNLAMLYTMAYVIIECVAWDTHQSFLEDATFVGTQREGVFRSTCVMTSAYIAHYSAPDFLKQLSGSHPRPLRGFRRAAMGSFGLTMVAYWLFAVAGYERFGSGVLGNILLNYETSICVLLAWVSMAATLVFGFPLVFKPARDTMAEVLSLNPPAKCRSEGESSASAPVSCPWGLMTTLVVVVTVALGIYFRDISRVLSFRGALLGCPISFILPGFMLLHCPGGTTGSKNLVHAWSLIVFGAFAGSLGLYCTFLY